MGAKKVITIYEDKNGPYLESLRQALIDTPEERCIKFLNREGNLKK